jgi:hypothetical protein
VAVITVLHLQIAILFTEMAMFQTVFQNLLLGKDPKYLPGNILRVRIILIV